MDFSADYRIPKVSDLFKMEIFQEIFKKSRIESPLKLIDINLSTLQLLVTRRKVRGLIDIPYSRTDVKGKLWANTMIRAHNFLVDLDLIPDGLVNLTKSQVSFHITNVLSVYNMVKKDPKSFFF